MAYLSHFHTCLFIIILLVHVTSQRQCRFNSTTLVAAYHEFLQGSLCYPCLSQCVNCLSETDQTCANGHCQIGYYFDPSKQKCLRCMSLCETCQVIQNVESTVKCIKCLDGYYFDEIKNECLQCLPGAKQCTYSSSLICFDGYYFDDQSLACKTCSSNCRICTIREACQQCNHEYILSISTNKCIKCPIEHCKTCTYLTSTTYACSQCLTGYQLFSNALCMKYSCTPSNCLQCSNNNEECTLCGNGYYLSDGICYYGSSLLCQYAEKGTDYGRCITCLSGISRPTPGLNGYCVPNLKNEGFTGWGLQNINGFESQYVSFVDEVLCSYPYTSSTSINSHFYTYELKIPPSYLIRITAFIILKQSSNILSDNLINISISPNSIDISSGQPTTINEQFHCLADKKYPNLKIKKIIKNFRIGSPLYQERLPYSQQSQNQPLKLTFSSQTQELISIRQMFIEMKTCTQQNCYRCLSSYACYQCFYPFFIQDYECVQSCDIGYNINNELRTCTFKCENGYYLNQIDSSCQKCRNTCKQCQSENKCTQCSQGYYLNDDGSCLSDCSTNQYQYPSQETKRCEKCENPCKTCQYNVGQTEKQLRCTSCVIGFYFQHQCLLNCPFGYYPSGNMPPKCLPCQFPCQSCLFSADICASCASSTYLFKGENSAHLLTINQFSSDFIPIIVNDEDPDINLTQIIVTKPICLSQCPKSYYIQQNKRICKKCKNPCDQCRTNTPHNCISCRYGYLLEQTTQNQVNGKCLNECPIGYYLSYLGTERGICLKCAHNCIQCTINKEASNQLCLKCSDGFNLENGGCVDQCSNGWPQGGICQQCHYPCKTCKSKPECLQCLPDFYLYLNNGIPQCTLRCPKGFYSIDKSQSITNIAICQQCQPQCETCLTITKCTSCKQGYIHKQSTLQCILSENCLQGFYQSNGICSLCASQCKTCENSSFFCVICADPGHYLHRQLGKCLQECPQSYLEDYSTRECNRCHQSCLTCEGTAEDCTSCDTSKYYFSESSKGKCISFDECQNIFGYFPYTPSSLCKECLGNCLDCESIVSCKLCSQGYYLLNGKCTQQCYPGYYKSSQSMIESFYFEENSLKWTEEQKLQILKLEYASCLSCHSNCEQCSEHLVCSSCKQGYFIQQISSQQAKNSLFELTNYQSSTIQDSYIFCMESCPDLFYPDHLTNKCNECRYPCKKCSNLLVCITCEDGLIYHNGQCLEICPDNHYLNNQEQVCQLCENPGCSSCEQQDTCLECKSGYFHFSQSLTCLTSCPDSYYEDFYQNRCIKCSPPCHFCFSQFQCQTCIQEYFLKDNRCYSVCPIGSYLSQTSTSIRICQNCPIFCSKCYKEDKCESCVPNAFILIQQEQQLCVRECPPTHYLYIPSKKCIKCSDNCATCENDRTICTSCPQQLYLQNKKCVSNCTEGYYLSANQTFCQKCEPGCLQCDEEGCFRCYNSYLLADQEEDVGDCVMECPIGYYISIEDFKCQACPKGCIDCASAKVCLQCSSDEGYILMNVVCIEFPCPFELYYDKKQNRCLSQCNSEEYLIDQQNRKCYDKLQGCPKPLIQRGSQKCVDQCSVSQYIGWQQNKNTIKCISGKSSNIFSVSVINKNGILRVLIEFNQIMKIDQNWAYIFTDIKVQTVKNKTRRVLLSGFDSEKVEEITSRIQNIGSVIENRIIFDVELITEEQPNQYGKFMPYLLVTVTLKQPYPSQISDDSGVPLQNKKYSIEMFNSIVSTKESTQSSKPQQFHILSVTIWVISLLIPIGIIYRNYKSNKALLYTTYIIWQHFQILQIAAFFNVEWGPMLGSYLRGFGIFYGWNYTIEQIKVISPSPYMFHVHTEDCSLTNIIPSISFLVVTLIIGLILTKLEHHKKLPTSISKISGSINIYTMALFLFIPNIFMFSLAKIFSILFLNWKNIGIYLKEFPIEIFELVISCLFLIGIVIVLFKVMLLQYHDHRQLDAGIITQKKAIIRQLPMHYQIRKLGLIILAITYSNNGLYPICFGIISTIFTLTMITWYQPYRNKIRYRLSIVNQCLLGVTFILMFGLALNTDSSYEILGLLLLITTIINWILNLAYPIILIVRDNIVEESINNRSQLWTAENKNQLQNSPQKLINPHQYPQQHKQIVHIQQYVQQQISQGRQADQSSLQDSDDDHHNKKLNDNQLDDGRFLKKMVANYKEFKHYDIVDDQLSNQPKQKAIIKAMNNQELIEQQMKLRRLVFQHTHEPWNSTDQKNQ